VSQTAFEFDRAALGAAAKALQGSAQYLAGLGGFLPTDPLALAELRGHISELRGAVDRIATLADDLQRLVDAQGLRRPIR
jgi:hypothetical protein